MDKGYMGEVVKLGYEVVVINETETIEYELLGKGLSQGHRDHVLFKATCVLRIICIPGL